nr:unnamed protein product [Callosobruchus analis]
MISLLLNYISETMKCVILLVVLSVSYVLGADKSPTVLDDTNLDEILKNDRLVRQYIDCVEDKKPCTKQGQELKARVKDALETGCEKCTDKQKQGAKKVIRHLMKNKPAWWKELNEHLDPDGKYKAKFDAFIKEVEAGV